MAEPMALMSEQQVALLYRVQADIEQVLQLQRQQLSAAALAAELETESAAAMLAAAVPPGAPRGAAVAPAEMPSGPDEDCESPEDFASAAASSDTAAAQAAEQDLLARQLAWSCDLAWPETFGLRLQLLQLLSSAGSANAVAAAALGGCLLLLLAHLLVLLFDSCSWLRFPIWPALISRVLTIAVVLLIPQILPIQAC